MQYGLGQSEERSLLARIMRIKEVAYERGGDGFSARAYTNIGVKPFGFQFVRCFSSLVEEISGGEDKNNEQYIVVDWSISQAPVRSTAETSERGWEELQPVLKLAGYETGVAVLRRVLGSDAARRRRKS